MPGETKLRSAFILYSAQFVNLVAPLALIPYLTRSLGESGFGNFSLALNIATYLQVLVLYGFEISGSRAVARLTNDASRSALVARIVSTRLVIVAFASLILIAVAAYESGRDRWDVAGSLVLLIPFLLSAAFSCTWFWVGIGNTLHAALSTVVSRGLLVVGTLILVKDPSDSTLYAGIFSLSALTGAIYGLVAVWVVLGRSALGVKRRGLVEHLIRGFPVFLSAISGTILAGIGLSVVGLMATSENFGGYAAQLRLAALPVLAYAPLGQLLLPRLAVRYSTAPDSTQRAVNRLSLVAALAAILSWAVITANSTTITVAAFGPEFRGSAVLLGPLWLGGSLSVVSGIVGVLGLLARGLDRSFNLCVGATACIGVPVMVLAYRAFGVSGVAWAAPCLECLLILLFLLTARARRRDGRGAIAGLTVRAA